MGKNISFCDFSAPETKAQMHYCDHALAVVRPSSLTIHIFDFSPETAERNSTKLDRKQDFYQVGGFWADRKNKMTALSSGRDIFDFSSETTERNSTKLDRKQNLYVLYQVCVFRADQKSKMAAPVSDFLRHFRILLGHRRTELNETSDRKQDPNVLYQVCVFQADRKNKMAAPVSHWPRHFRLLL